MFLKTISEAEASGRVAEVYGGAAGFQQCRAVAARRRDADVIPAQARIQGQHDGA